MVNDMGDMDFYEYDEQDEEADDGDEGRGIDEEGAMAAAAAAPRDDAVTCFDTHSGEKVQILKKKLSLLTIETKLG